MCFPRCGLCQFSWVPCRITRSDATYRRRANSLKVSVVLLLLWANGYLYVFHNAWAKQTVLKVSDTAMAILLDDLPFKVWLYILLDFALLKHSDSLAWLRIAVPPQQECWIYERSLKKKIQPNKKIGAFQVDLRKTDPIYCKTHWKYHAIDNCLVARHRNCPPSLLLLLCLRSTWLSMFLFRQATATPVHVVPEPTTLHI